MAQHARMIRVTTFTAADGRLDDLLEAVRSNTTDAAAAKGCFGAQAMAVEGQPGVVAAISRWRDRDALDRFLGEHEGRAHDAVAGFVVGPASSTHYSALPD